MSLQRVVVTGLGCVTPLGHSVRQSWSSLLHSRSGIVPVTQLPNYDSDYRPHANSIPETTSVGKVAPLAEHSDLFTAQDERRLSTFAKFAMLASREALQTAKLLQPGSVVLDESQVNAERIGCVIGSGIASIEDMYSTSVQFHNERKRVNPLFVPKILTNMAAGNVSIKFNLKGPSHSASTACATGNNAIGDAYNLIRLGMQDACVAGASEACVHPLSLAGFVRAKSITTTDGVSRPFDTRRSGFVLGEGAGVVVLESLQHAVRRNAPILAEVRGYGLSSDAYHITSPSPRGEGASRAISMALGQVAPSAVDFVNAHATSTLLGDRAECCAIRAALLHTNSPRENPLYVSSNKGAMGHLLGAAGAVESIFTIMSLRENIIPHTLNLQSVGGASGDEPENFQGLHFVMGEPRPHNTRYGLCNSFGFGGINTSLLFEKWRE